MPTYQEQIEANERRKQADAEKSFTEFLGWIADGVMPLFHDGTLTMEQVEKVVKSVSRSFVNGVANRKPSQYR